MMQAVTSRRRWISTPAGRAFACAALGVLALLPGNQLSAQSTEPCRPATHLSRAYTVCTFDLRKTDLRLFWRSEEGTPFAAFGALADYLKGRGETLAFATNAGMYHP